MIRTIASHARVEVRDYGRGVPEPLRRVIFDKFKQLGDLLTDKPPGLGLGLPMARLNPNGGSIAIGHPFGMTGSRLVGTLMNELHRRGGRYGIVTMCVGGGQGAAALFERP